MAAAQTTLRIGLAEDPDVLDPTLARTYVGRIVFASLCDKLFDIDEKLNVVPQLALVARDLRRRQDGDHQAASGRASSMTANSSTPQPPSTASTATTPCGFVRKPESAPIDTSRWSTR